MGGSRPISDGESRFLRVIAGVEHAAAFGVRRVHTVERRFPRLSYLPRGGARSPSFCASNATVLETSASAIQP
jgi:uncharacterized protein YifE (UPF0438 family)